MENKIKINNIKLGKVIGEGGCGRVVLGVDRITNEEYAVKIIEKNKLSNDGIKRIYFEAEIMQQLKHKNILKLQHITEDDINIYIIMEYAKHGDLLQYLHTRQMISENEARKLFVQLLDALDYAHQKNIVHRDIKLENILLDNDNEVIIGDWGFAEYWEPNKKIKCNLGSNFYAAPEVFLGQEITGPEADIWSLGIVLYTMITGLFPFTGSNNEEILDNIMKGNIKIPSYCSKYLSGLICDMLTSEPNLRISMNEIRTHPWLKLGEPTMPTSSPQKSNDKVLVKEKLLKRTAITVIFSVFKSKACKSVYV